MKWYNYLACFFVGVTLVNSIPHFINGISGNYFPTPFARPPGKGLSPPLLNIAWAYMNMAFCYFLWRGAKLSLNNKWSVLIFILGIVAMSIRLSISLSNKAG